MEIILKSQKRVLRELQAIPSLKQSTRQELYFRLSRARDFIRSCAAEDLKISAIAAEACLSPHHFLRTYKKAFGISPHQELLNIRLAKALKLMTSENEGISLTEIAIECGFNEFSSFSKAFKQRFGTPPSRFDFHLPTREMDEQPN